MALLAMFLAVLVLNAACAEVLRLPEGLTEIADEGFAGCCNLTEAFVPQGTKSVGTRAFYGCNLLRKVIVPESVTSIGDECFEDCSEALLIGCAPDSAALDYARRNGFDYDSGTVCRALVIGQSYTGSNIALRGTVNDADAVASMLSNQKDRAFQVYLKNDLTAAEILQCTQEAFADATDRDISLLFYSGHGGANGELVGTDRGYVAPTDLRSVLDSVPGRRIIIIDACYSGYWVSDVNVLLAGDAAEEEPFTGAFIQNFIGRARSAGEYYVIASAQSYEECQERMIYSGSQRKLMGCFTYWLCCGCGWNGVTESGVPKAADVNEDGAVSIAEAFEYASVRAKAMNYAQNAQTNAADCRSFAPFR